MTSRPEVLITHCSSGGSVSLWTEQTAEDINLRCTLNLQPTFVSQLKQQPVEMENMQEFIPFVKEMWSQKPSRGLLRVYLVGSVFAVLGTVIGLVETVCQPFCSSEPMDAEMVFMLARQQRADQAEVQHSVGSHKGEEEEEEKEEELAAENEAMTQTSTESKTHRLIQRAMTNRLHAS